MEQNGYKKLELTDPPLIMIYQIKGIIHYILLMFLSYLSESILNPNMTEQTYFKKVIYQSD